MRSLLNYRMFFVILTCLGIEILSFRCIPLHTLPRKALISAYQMTSSNLNKLPFDPDEDDWIEKNIQEEKAKQQYIPRLGLESKLAYYGNRRPMSLQEYILLFDIFPTLKTARNENTWPDDRILSDREKLRAEKASLYITTLNTTIYPLKQRLPIMQKHLRQFRTFLDNTLKTSSGNYFGSASVGLNLTDKSMWNVARKYNDLIRLLLVNEIFGSDIFSFLSPTENLSYITHMQSFQNVSSVVAINATSLWMDCVTNYFGLQLAQVPPGTYPSNENSVGNDDNEVLADIRYHLQQPVNMSEIVRMEIRDVLTNILRFVIHSIFHENPHVEQIQILYPSSYQLNILHDYQQFFPAVIVVELLNYVNYTQHQQDRTRMALNIKSNISDINDCYNNDKDHKYYYDEDGDVTVYIFRSKLPPKQ